MSIGIDVRTMAHVAAGLCPPSTGGYFFAEDPTNAAPVATIIWSATFDPGTLRVRAVPANARDPDAVVPSALRGWLRASIDQTGEEHVTLSDGMRRIRLDVTDGTLRDGPVILHYDLAGLAGLKPKLVSLRRLIALASQGRFPSPLYPADARVRRWVQALRVSDALRAGASHREIGSALLGEAAVARGWDGCSDSARSHVRRLIREARRLAAGGFWEIMGDRRGLPPPFPVNVAVDRRGGDQ